MTTHSETVVHVEGNFQIVRQKYWGFRCQSLSTSWLVQRKGMTVSICQRLRDAKRHIEILKTTPMLSVSVNEAGRLLASVS